MVRITKSSKSNIKRMYNKRDVENEIWEYRTYIFIKLFDVFLPSFT